MPGCAPPGDIVLPAIVAPPEAVAPEAAAPVEVGAAGASAQREYERRSARHHDRVQEKIVSDRVWRKQVKEDHPLMGRLAAAVTPKPVEGPEPQHVKAWSKGSDGEQKVGRRLDHWAAAGHGHVLHDRRIPRTPANIDHIAIGAFGVWVIDAKKYDGKVELVNVGGLFRPDVRLKVAGRDRSKLADGVLRQMELVAAALDRASATQAHPKMHGMLCFVGTEWGLFAKPFAFKGVNVAWPAAMVDLLGDTVSLPSEQITVTTSAIAAAFPPA